MSLHWPPPLNKTPRAASSNPHKVSPLALVASTNQGFQMSYLKQKTCNTCKYLNLIPILDALLFRYIVYLLLSGSSKVEAEIERNSLWSSACRVCNKGLFVATAPSRTSRGRSPLTSSVNEAFPPRYLLVAAYSLLIEQFSVSP